MTDLATQAAALPPRVKRWGFDRDPLPRRNLRAGPVTAVLEGGDLRYVQVSDVEIVRRLYMAVRDRNWNTIEPHYTRYELTDHGDSFTLELAAEHVNAEVDFAWTGQITGDRDGTIRYEMHGEARHPFLRARIGFCVLHPMELAGVPAVVTTPDGTVDRPFPIRISPHQPFMDIVKIAHPAGNWGSCEIAFEGELFEMEDQRNWTDASYKTYGTPLRLPFPVQIEPGQPVIQTVTIRVEGTGATNAATTTPRPDIAIGAPIGTLPPIGLSANPPEAPLTPGEIGRLRALRPAHLWAAIDLSAAGHDRQTASARAQAEALGCPLRLEVAGVTAETAATLRDVLASAGELIEAISVYPPAANPPTFPRHDNDTSGEVIDLALQAAHAAGSGAAVGGGTRAYFTELNRAAERLPLDRMAWATYTINPQVHAYDDASLVETLAAQSVTVDSAHAIVGTKPLVVGPVTLRQPFNPNATGPAPEPAANELPADVDPRQMSLFAAAWTVGSIRRLATGTAALTFDRLTGWRGLMEREGDLPKRQLFPAVPGQLFALYHVFAAIAGMTGAEVLAVDVVDPLALEALALQRGNETLILVANVKPASQQAAVAVPGTGAYRIAVLDESSYGSAAADPAFFATTGETTTSTGGQFTLDLPPYAVACLTKLMP